MTESSGLATEVEIPAEVRRRGGAIPLTVVVLARDEERDIGDCLRSLRGVTDDVHVLDSGSRDATTAIAEAEGATVHHHPFSGFGTQRNWAIDNIPHRYDWAFHLDADERVTPPLAAEIGERIESAPPEAGFYVPSKLMFHGRWLRFAGGYPTYQLRLFHRRRLRFRDHGHGQREVTDGRVGYLREPYLHYAFSKGLDHWLTKHAAYARREAEELGLGRGDGPLRDLVSRDRVGRRRALKSLAYRMPGRPTLRFWKTVLLQRAFLDGRPGIAYAKMLAAYEAMISVHLAAGRLVSRGDSEATRDSGDRRFGDGPHGVPSGRPVDKPR